MNKGEGGPEGPPSLLHWVGAICYFSLVPVIRLRMAHNPMKNP